MLSDNLIRFYDPAPALCGVDTLAAGDRARVTVANGEFHEVFEGAFISWVGRNAAPLGIFRVASRVTGALLAAFKPALKVGDALVFSRLLPAPAEPGLAPPLLPLFSVFAVNARGEPRAAAPRRWPLSDLAARNESFAAWRVGLSDLATPACVPAGFADTAEFLERLDDGLLPATDPRRAQALLVLEELLSGRLGEYLGVKLIGADSSLAGHHHCCALSVTIKATKWFYLGEARSEARSEARKETHALLTALAASDGWRYCLDAQTVKFTDLARGDSARGYFVEGLNQRAARGVEKSLISKTLAQLEKGVGERID
jgi:hypothetical protein